MKTKVVVTCAICFYAAVRSAAGEEFVRGHVYISVLEGEGCEMGADDWIVRFDPETTQLSVLTDLSEFGAIEEGFCEISGLRFTPDGSRLLMLNRGVPFKPYNTAGSVVSFDASGSGEVFLDVDDGIQNPWGKNGLAFDAQGDLYVMNRLGRILRYPADGGAFTVFADGAGLGLQCSSLDFSPDGDLFCAGAGAIIRIAPNGEDSAFDALSGVRSLVFDRRGNLFASTFNALYQYIGSDPNQRRLIASGFVPYPIFPVSMAVAPFGDVVYVGTYGGLIHRVDVATKRVTVVADLNDAVVAGFFAYSVGMTVYDPLVLDDFDGDGDVDLHDFSRFSECVSRDPGPMTPGCLAGDSDGDGDVDFVDFGDFQRRFTGSKQADCRR
jgi:hypothetical protein